MIGRARVGCKYFFWGMLIGILFAPNSGKETRQKIWNKFKGMVDAVLGLI